CGMKVVYNPTPLDSNLAISIPWNKVDVIIVNETEALELVKILGGDVSSFPSDAKAFSVENWTDLATKLSSAEQFSRGFGWLIVTLGSKGSLALQSKTDGSSLYSSCVTPPVPVQDTTGAGDTFLGYLVSHLARHCDTGNRNISPEIMQRSIELASAASALAVTRPGAMASIPSIDEVVKYFPKSLRRSGIDILQ
ncbi:putative ribokinase, partial [Massospora cicadina]